jgi:hypothetical protein
MGNSSFASALFAKIRMAAATHAAMNAAMIALTPSFLISAALFMRFFSAQRILRSSSVIFVSPVFLHSRTNIQNNCSDNNIQTFVCFVNGFVKKIEQIFGIYVCFFGFAVLFYNQGTGNTHGFKPEIYYITGGFMIWRKEKSVPNSRKFWII